MAESKYYNNVHYEVGRTGKLQQYYTLYRFMDCGVTGFWHRNNYSYIKNLSHDLDKALAEAEKIAGDTTSVDYVESPKEEYDEFKAFDLTWKNGRNCYFSYPNNDFWAIWRDNKDSLKQMGFWVSKPKGTSEFMVFCRLDESKEITELPELKTEYPSIENGRQLLSGKLTNVKESISDYGVSLRATFELESGYKINGTLPKGLSVEDIGKTFSFNGTIEDQGKGFGFYKRPAKAVKV